MAKQVLLLTYPRSASAEDIENACRQAQAAATKCDAVVLVLPDGFRLTNASVEERLRALEPCPSNPEGSLSHYRVVENGAVMCRDCGVRIWPPDAAAVMSEVAS